MLKVRVGVKGRVFSGLVGDEVSEISVLIRMEAAVIRVLPGMERGVLRRLGRIECRLLRALLRMERIVRWIGGVVERGMLCGVRRG